MQHDNNVYDGLHCSNDSRRVYEMRISEKGIQLIKRFEGCQLTAYKAAPTEKMYTIGYGHYGVEAGMVITQAQADAYLKDDLEKYDNYIDKYVTADITQGMHDALVSFAYNCGAGNLKSSTLLKKLNQRDYIGAAEEFCKWNKANSKVLKGLTRRRQAEKERFLEDMGVLTYSKGKDGNLSLSANFKVKEFACKDGSDTILIDVDFVRNCLQKIREHFGAPVTINSAYRTSAYNTKVGGAKSSYHMKGQAFDIVVKGHTPNEVAKHAQALGINGIIQYNTFVHVDSRATKYWARNNNGKITKLNTF